jgi:NAD+ diphosphatase
MGFEPGYKESRSQAENDYVFIFSGSDLLVNKACVPTLEQAAEFLAESELRAEVDAIYFGTIDGHNCYAFSLPKDSGNEESETWDGYEIGDYQFVMLRRYISELDSNICAAAGYASHMLYWHEHSLFCGRCGTKNNWYEKERAKTCPSCGNLQFPKIAPAIIIMIRKGNEILLAHNSRFPEGRYSLLAGFMEMGETIEETARREVMEEVGITIENIRYLESQSWPFPESLMIGLTADYKSGDIVPDGKEIVHADWYQPDKFPLIPGHGTIARKIIDIYTKTYKS